MFLKKKYFGRWYGFETWISSKHKQRVNLANGLSFVDGYAFLLSFETWVSFTIQLCVHMYVCAVCVRV